jgi:hypothetical protein
MSQLRTPKGERDAGTFTSRAKRHRAAVAAVMPFVPAPKPQAPPVQRAATGGISPLITSQPGQGNLWWLRAVNIPDDPLPPLGSAPPARYSAWGWSQVLKLARRQNDHAA